MHDVVFLGNHKLVAHSIGTPSCVMDRLSSFVFRARPARYGDMFSDVYNFPVNHPRHRDLALGDKSPKAILEHSQMQKIVSFLRSGEEDFLDLTVA